VAVGLCLSVLVHEAVAVRALDHVVGDVEQDVIFLVDVVLEQVKVALALREQGLDRPLVARGGGGE